MHSMLRVLCALTFTVPLALLATPARAQSAMTVTAHFVENTSKQAGCAADLCGTGVVLPFGQATDALVFGTCGNPAQCPAVKTFTLATGTMAFVETFVPGSARCSDAGQGQACGLLTGTVSDTLAYGTGAYAGASGSLVGTFAIANPSNPDHSARVDYTGTVALP